MRDQSQKRYFIDLFAAATEVLDTADNAIRMAPKKLAKHEIYMAGLTFIDAYEICVLDYNKRLAR